jgi:arsenate reductase
MREIHLDLSSAQPKNVREFTNCSFDYVITVCDGAKETCPVFSGQVKNRLHLGFDDPANATGSDEEILRVFRRVRDEIRRDFGKFYEKEIRPKL